MKFIAAWRLALFAGLSALPVYAHDLVILPQGEQDVAIRFGHPGEYEPADLARLLRLDAYAQGAPEAVSLLEQKPVRRGVDWVEENCTQFTGGQRLAMIAGEYDNGYWIAVTPKRYFNTSRAVLPEGKDAGHYLKFAKGLFPAVGANFDRVVGQQLEIIPRTDPFKVRPGEKLAVKVVFEGKPLKGAGVEIGDGQTKMKEEDIPRYQTGADGVAELPISHEGLQVIAIDWRLPPLHPDLCDHEDYSASLTFLVLPSGSPTN
ncbi:MAG: DUF4198 domain-containing protein [Verrucomicrobia bacterium]|nr:DUF4198 domain-containing protein [Verrucomicrobiota bacterium]